MIRQLCTWLQFSAVSFTLISLFVLFVLFVRVIFILIIILTHILLNTFLHLSIFIFFSNIVFIIINLLILHTLLLNALYINMMIAFNCHIHIRMTVELYMWLVVQVMWKSSICFLIEELASTLRTRSVAGYDKNDSIWVTLFFLFENRLIFLYDYYDTICRRHVIV